MSTVAKDGRNRKKVTDHLKSQGAMVELVQHRNRYGCHDLWGADLIVKRPKETGIEFLQVKQARKAKNGGPVRDLAGPIKKFAEYGPWPECIWLSVALCLDGERLPYLYDVTDEVQTKWLEDKEQ